MLIHCSCSNMDIVRSRYNEELRVPADVVLCCCCCCCDALISFNSMKIASFCSSIALKGIINFRFHFPNCSVRFFSPVQLLNFVDLYVKKREWVIFCYRLIPFTTTYMVESLWLVVLFEYKIHWNTCILSTRRFMSILSQKAHTHTYPY